SGDSFIGSSEQRQKIKQQFPEAMAVEMEATAIAQTCYQFKVPFIVTRAVSDLANGKALVSEGGNRVAGWGSGVQDGRVIEAYPKQVPVRAATAARRQRTLPPAASTRRPPS
ncbi:phosphorylase family protein, partial [Micromonospora chersina]